MTSNNGAGMPDYIVSRLARLRALMAEKKLEAYLITNRMDYYYLTGCTAEVSGLILTDRLAHFITDSRFDETVELEAPWLKKHIRKKLLVDEAAKVLKKLKLRTVGFQGDDMTVATADELKKLAAPVKFKPVPNLVKQLRRIKDERELELMGRAMRIAEDAFTETCRQIRPGMTENEVAGRLEYEMKRRGSSAPAFHSIVAEGANASLPHAQPGERMIREGSGVLFDWGATVGFYRSDLTRTVGIGSMPPRIREIYEVTLEAQNRALEAVRAGARVNRVDAVARKHIKSAGFGKAFAHGLGHGLGLDVHEGPSVSWRSKEPLEAGMVVTVEPGIYLPGVGGVRIEDDVLVTPKGAQVLSRLPKSLKDAILT